jgi:hypothetical protein
MTIICATCLLFKNSGENSMETSNAKMEIEPCYYCTMSSNKMFERIAKFVDTTRKENDPERT